jgi:UDP-N-acetylmuramoyl-L-alanyl-D-glutamate--2,6-diaminopimelate ligase
MTLATLLLPLDVVSATGNLEVELSGITDDSREVAQGSLFVAVKGQQVDGHSFVVQVCRQQIGGVVVQAPFQAPSHVKKEGGPAWIEVKDSRKALGQLASRFFQDPSQSLLMVGVTGTNGKTTVVHVSQAILERGGYRTGLMGTVGYHVGQEYQAASHTTPGAIPLQAFLHRMVEAGMDTAVLEVSSHALALDRVEGCGFDTVVFTNLTQDHLDFHETMESYYHAKLRLFQEFVVPASKTGPKRAIINIDDAWGVRLQAETPVPVWTYSLRRRADIYATNVTLSMDGTRFTVHTPRGSLDIQSALVGEHNVSNLLASIGVGLARGMSLDDVRQGILGFRTVPGRFEHVEAGQDFSVIVDYAHTEDALAQLLAAARQLRRERIITVFGCGGDRDPGKRPKMGRVAAQRSDVVFLTSDNPRTEDPEAILRDIEQGVLGLSASERGASYVIPDRRAAIRAALLEARPGDVVLIAGKGHEDYQVIGKTRHRFDDREVVRELLADLPDSRKR